MLKEARSGIFLSKALTNGHVVDAPGRGRNTSVCYTCACGLFHQTYLP